MTLQGLFWPDTNYQDIHLLPGLVSPRLDHLLWTSDTRGNRRAHNPHPGVTVSFAARFAGAPAAHGVTMSAATGEIAVASPLPAGPRLRSFLVTATATEGATTVTARMRVNVHQQITRLWLTPSPLTVRRGAGNMRLSLMAQFDDGVVADITNWSPFDPPAAADRTYVRRSGSNDPLMVWSTSNAATISVDPVTGVLDARAAAGNADITVAHPPFPPPVPATATVRVNAAAAWSTPVRLTHVSGPGFGSMGQVSNILFLPDGFVDTPAERAAYEKLVRGVVSRLSVRQKTRPFDLIKGSLNYFMGWVPSPQPGISVLNELDRVNKAGANADGRALALPSRNPGGAGAWSLRELIHEVGLPTPVNDPDASPLGTAAAGRLHDWQTLYGAHVTAARVSGVYPAWLDRNDRMLLSERDTAFHTAMSYRPRVDGVVGERTITFHPRRLNHGDFDTFLDALQDSAGGAVDNVWSRGGKDDDLVVVMCRTNRNGGSNAVRGDGHYLCVSLRDDSVHRLTTNPGGNGFDVRPDPIPGDVHPDTWTTIAHELAHSWTLADEYGGDGTVTPAVVTRLAQKTNAQPRSGLLNGAGQLVTANLKWRWPRIAKAGVLTANPGAVGPNFRLILQPGHAGPFAVDDIVRLRTRPLLSAGPPSDRFRVRDVAGDELEIEPLPGSALVPASFPAGSIVMMPVRAPDPAPGVLGDDLELVAQTVRARIDATHNPLNANPLVGEVAAGQVTDAVNRACTAGAFPTPTPATNFPGGAAPNPPRFSSWIVGLYENAAAIDCDVYRPTGICLMRRLLFDEAVANRTRAYQFCPVCRYAMVDLLEPTKHGAIDADFAPRYPA